MLHHSKRQRLSEKATAAMRPAPFRSIPSFKGKFRSHPFEAVVSEAQTLAAAGARELSWSRRIPPIMAGTGRSQQLPRLLQAIARRAEGLDWLSLMYGYPGHVTDELIETMATTPQILPYLDIPLQHGHATTLRRMKRPSNLNMVYDTISRLRVRPCRTSPFAPPLSSAIRRDRGRIPGPARFRAGPIR